MYEILALFVLIYHTTSYIQYDREEVLELTNTLFNELPVCRQRGNWDPENCYLVRDCMFYAPNRCIYAYNNTGNSSCDAGSFDPPDRNNNYHLIYCVQESLLPVTSEQIPQYAFLASLQEIAEHECVTNNSSSVIDGLASLITGVDRQLFCMYRFITYSTFPIASFFSPKTPVKNPHQVLIMQNLIGSRNCSATLPLALTQVLYASGWTYGILLIGIFAINFVVNCIVCYQCKQGWRATMNPYMNLLGQACIFWTIMHILHSRLTKNLLELHRMLDVVCPQGFIINRILEPMYPSIAFFQVMFCAASVLLLAYRIGEANRIRLAVVPPIAVTPPVAMNEQPNKESAEKTKAA